MVSSISLSGLSCITPDGKPLFTNIDFNFTAERVGLVGRNGVGKTTLLRLIAGEMAPQAGSITVSGTSALMRQDAITRPDATGRWRFSTGQQKATPASKNLLTRTGRLGPGWRLRLRHMV
ncbi:ATPase subunit of ABC transporter with duplicated ATPase domains [Agrobacterium larrymoorei]|uniref:ATPase subunit of ABC transporter with duplicated ATPase domains n=1 Tax=Agrobacterium larrymoorei TaxID=160699 RepID=A0ABU0UN08_9HYPH|nr:ATPase subunit of ABC transporter with duplicated ATPase domains [Agrobacterium larrymoorei]